MALEKTRAKFNDQEEEAQNNFSGPDLEAKLAEIRSEKQKELDRIKNEAEAAGRQAEVALREQHEDKFFKEKEALLAKDEERKRAMLK